MVTRNLEDSDPTGEEEALEFDGAQTDQLDGTYRMRVVTASENGKGTVDYDDRGRARWKWSTEASMPAASDTGTFDLLKSLDNDALSLIDEEPPPSDPPIDKKAGYDPYGTALEEAPPKGFSMTKRRVKTP